MDLSTKMWITLWINCEFLVINRWITGRVGTIAGTSAGTTVGTTAGTMCPVDSRYPLGRKASKAP